MFFLLRRKFSFFLFFILVLIVTELLSGVTGEDEVTKKVKTFTQAKKKTVLDNKMFKTITIPTFFSKLKNPATFLIVCNSVKVIRAR